MKKIIIGSDHAGFYIKQAVIAFLKKNGYSVTDVGPAKYNPNDDYPEFVSLVASEVSKSAASKHSDPVRGIVLGASGQGEAMVANKYPHVRAAVYYGYGFERGNLTRKQEEMEALYAMRIIELSRLHNDANILSLGASFLSEDEAKSAVKLWLETPFSGDARHVRRIEEIEKLKI